MKQFLTELLLGDQSEDKEFRLSRLHAHEGGMISMSPLFVTLAFFVLIGFLGNAGQAVYRKIEVQNAADSMAHSTTVWMARHMNAVTVTNHLMGELTAVVVLIEGLGGPELDGSKEKVILRDGVISTLRLLTSPPPDPKNPRKGKTSAADNAASISIPMGPFFFIGTLVVLVREHMAN